MAQIGYPFDGLDTSESDFSYMFRELQDTGVVGDSDLTVTADGSGLNVKVAAGQAFVRGFAYRSTAVETLAIATGESNPRIDTVVVRLDPVANTIALLVLRGTAATSPAAPALTQTDTDKYDLPLADVAVAANAVTIPASAVTLRRPRSGMRLRPWTNATRPASPRKWQLGYNEEAGLWEFWTGSAWTPLLSWGSISGRPTKSTIDGRTIFVSASAPTAADGANGDLWFGI
ncbi:hypothetical protein [Cellulomonas sp. SG140]|uniref:hypothetical protein n=1 Tax=Cellulomonas sp. SG140 TaxID=2976536 RepID=UPI0021E78CCE|nr:hypothetical protein [Cellulomonas sp. SG140]